MLGWNGLSQILRRHRLHWGVQMICYLLLGSGTVKLVGWLLGLVPMFELELGQVFALVLEYGVVVVLEQGLELLV